MLELIPYLGLFSVAFGAATLLPLQSEAVLVGMLLSERFSPLGLLLVASVGNIAGSVVNWGLGRAIERYRHKRWFPVSPGQLHKAQRFYGRYGRWTLLLSWVPIIGDPLTLVAGVMRERFWPFLLLVSMAKTARYGVIVLMTQGWG